MTTWQKQQGAQPQKTLEKLEQSKKQQCINTILLQQLDVEQSPWTIDQLDELSETAREGPRSVIHKIEIETTHQQKAMDSHSNFRKEFNINRLQEKMHRFIMHPERLFLQMEMQVRQHLIQTEQFRAKQGLLESNLQIFRRHLLHNSREILFVNQKLRGEEKRHLSEVKPQAQILLLLQTRTRVKTSSADSQVRAPGQLQLIGIQNRAKKNIHTLEIFPRTLMEETLQPQPNIGMGRKTIRYLET
ncbi:MAG: hypothetical protein EZS28_040541 [Streblomastix strix]|uniref:Uncharacterized protein n=1 Tax=Streblomastix strix TaxID=222440 RepID=A0A5J4U1P4_9EUKA|nr:MAG: hypothetical protein EZS28_040541 [Streblomastix strix]